MAYCCLFNDDVMDDDVDQYDPFKLLPVDTRTLLDPSLTPEGADRLMRAAPCSLQRFVRACVERMDQSL